MAFVLFWLIAATISARQPTVEPATPVRQIHNAMIKPASDAIFNVAREAPENADAWAAMAAAGVTLAKSGQLMTVQAPASYRERWMTQSRQLIRVGRTAQRAAQARNLNSLLHASDRLIIVCETCHARYRSRTAGTDAR